MLGIRGVDAYEPSGTREHFWDGTAVPALGLEVEEDDLQRQRINRRLEHKHVFRAPVVEKDAVVGIFVTGAPEGGEEGVGEWLLQCAACGVEEVAQGRRRDVLHEEEVRPTVWSMGKSYDTVEYRCGSYAKLCDAQMESDLSVDDALHTHF